MQSVASLLHQCGQQHPLKALAFTQPWATLVASGAKRVETRSWATKHTGPLAIHAAQSFPPWAQDLCDTEPFRHALEQAGYQKDAEAQHNAWGLPLGQIVAVAWLDRVERIPANYPVSEQEHAFGNFAPGRYAWHFSSIYQLRTPIVARGSLGLWNWQPPEFFWAEIQAQHQ